ncbi:hypothetical protein RQP46_009793 [Phenoliferia psychrophenolica]
MVHLSLAFVAAPLALAELLASAVLSQLPLFPPRPSIPLSHSHRSSIAIANWKQLTALQRHHGGGISDAEAAQHEREDEERRWFKHLLAEAHGGVDRIPEMFGELVGKVLPQGREAVTSEAEDAAVAQQLVEEPRSEADDEFYAQLTFGSRTADLVRDASGFLWMVDENCRATVSSPLQTRPASARRRDTAFADPTTSDSRTSSLDVGGDLIAIVTKNSGRWDVEVVLQILGSAIPSLPKNPSSSLCQALLSEPHFSSETYSFNFEGPGSSRLVVRTAGQEAMRRGVEWIAAETEPEWRVDLAGLATSNGTAALSSRPTFMHPSLGAFAILPPSDAADLHRKISHDSMVEQIAQHPGFFSFDCDATFPLSLHLEGTSISIPRESLNLGRVSFGSNRCVSGIISSESTGKAILGMQAFRRLTSSMPLFSSPGVIAYIDDVLTKAPVDANPYLSVAKDLTNFNQIAPSSYSDQLIALSVVFALIAWQMATVVFLTGLQVYVWGLYFNYEGRGVDFMTTFGAMCYYPSWLGSWLAAWALCVSKASLATTSSHGAEGFMSRPAVLNAHFIGVPILTISAILICCGITHLHYGRVFAANVAVMTELGTLALGWDASISAATTTEVLHTTIASLIQEIFLESDVVAAMFQRIWLAWFVISFCGLAGWLAFGGNGLTSAIGTVRLQTHLNL